MRFTIDVSVDDSAVPQGGSLGPETAAADELLDYLANLTDYPTWVRSIDGVDPA